MIPIEEQYKFSKWLMKNYKPDSKSEGWYKIIGWPGSKMTMPAIVEQWNIIKELILKTNNEL